MLGSLRKRDLSAEIIAPPWWRLPGRVVKTGLIRYCHFACGDFCLGSTGVLFEAVLITETLMIQEGGLLSHPTPMEIIS